MIFFEIIGFLLLALFVFALFIDAVEWVVKHRAELLTWAGIIAALWGAYALFGTPGVTGGVVLLVVGGLVSGFILDRRDERKASRKP
jgi:uncharacterized membrane protein YdcZ (DUF606 family)